ncbi:hypothetical protein CHU95_02070 [Niveispirillum lacus]|uniref:Serine/threonine specific protein phosphatases domain-containing protein n=2 Tax=Niveispirillum lacus TaxID=1981099 RepID=A0A255Z6Y0_9PROT|nr:hypothetical protein CHU95_02070 [Niveispirillum lacus]
MAQFRRYPPLTDAAERTFQIPDGQLVYAIGDIHGEAGLLRQLLATLRADADRHAQGAAITLIFLGDYLDRGPDSRQVLDILTDNPFPGARLQFLRGNHEQALLDFLVTPVEAQAWLRFGGTETLSSYGVRASPGLSDPARLMGLAQEMAERLPESHLAFLRQTRLMSIVGDYVFVHAGIRPGVPLAAQQPDDLLWIRDGFMDRPFRSDHAIVHGHTIIDIPILTGNRIGIDTGAYATGVLTALALSGQDRRLVQVGQGENNRPV